MKMRPMLTLEDCKKISAASEAEAKKNNWNVCIAILDDGGHLLHLVRMDGATPANSRIAIEKGRTAAESRRSTAMLQAQALLFPGRSPGIGILRPAFRSMPVGGRSGGGAFSVVPMLTG